MNLDPVSQNISATLPHYFSIYLSESPAQFFPIFSLLSLTSFCGR